MSGTVARSLGALGDAIGGTANVNFDAGTLFIDGVNNNVGVGTNSPLARLHVAGPAFRQNDATGSFGYTISTTSSTTTLATLFGGSSFAIQTSASGTDQLRIASNGNIGIGTTTPAARLDIAGGNIFVRGGSDGEGGEVRLFNPDGVTEGTYLDISSADVTRWFTIRNNSLHQIGQLLGTGGTITFHTAANERARIDASGTFFVGMTSVTGSGCAFERAAAGGRLYVGRTNNDTVAEWQFSGTRVGSISVTASGTAYNTSSDYRLKENITTIANAGERLLNLKPCRFNFINEPNRTVDGFLAHEAAEVVPQAVTGEKDAVNEDGSIKAQGIDHSKLVPLLTAALQEALLSINDLKAEVQTLKTKIAALESN